MALKIRLRGLTGEVEWRIWATPSSFRVGRRSTLEMVLHDSSVSRRHAEIRPDGECWTLTDLGSTNGTFVNGSKVASGQSVTLSRNDLVRFGNVTFVVERIDVADTPPAEPSPVLSEPPPDEGRSHCNRLWKVVVPGGRPLATPAIAGKRVFMGGGFGSHEFYAFDADTGEQSWVYHTRDDGPTAAITLDGLVAFNTESCELEVLTVDGKQVWKRWLGDPLLSTPAAANGRLFTVYPDSRGDHRHYLGCFGLQTGQPLWRQPIGSDAITAPVLAGGNVYVTTVAGKLCSFAQEDGKPLWEKRRDATSSPTVVGNTCYYTRRSQAQNEFSESFPTECLSNSQPDCPCMDYANSWHRADYLNYARRQAESTLEMSSVTLDGTVGFGMSKGDSSMEHSQVNLGQGTVAGIWSYQGSRPFMYRNRLYNAAGRSVQCVDPVSGDILWKTKVVDGTKPLVDHMLTPPVLVNAKVIVGTATGEVICLDAESGEWIWRESIGEAISFQPAVAHGRVYIPTAAGSLHCLDTADPGDDGWLMWGGTPAHNGLKEEHETVILVAKSL
jgi:Ca-activated chloride channel family protein